MNNYNQQEESYQRMQNNEGGENPGSYYYPGGAEEADHRAQDIHNYDNQHHSFQLSDQTRKLIIILIIFFSLLSFSFIRKIYD